MRRTAAMLIGLLALFAAQPARACLRTGIDDRAIQWSSLIVRATFESSQSPGDQKAGPIALAISTWKVTQTFDGGAKADADIIVLTFPPTDPNASVDSCNALPAKGQSAVMLLRAVKDCEFSQFKDLPQTHGDAYVIVTRLSQDDTTDDAVKDLTQRIAEVRKAESQFSEKDAQSQAQTLSAAMDDTEADQAESALIDMGAKAVPAIQESMKQADGAGKMRLQRVLAELSPPPADAGKRMP